MLTFIVREKSLIEACNLNDLIRNYRPDFPFAGARARLAKTCVDMARFLLLLRSGGYVVCTPSSHERTNVCPSMRCLLSFSSGVTSVAFLMLDVGPPRLPFFWDIFNRKLRGE
jgi:hypothetical protein